MVGKGREEGSKDCLKSVLIRVSPLKYFTTLFARRLY